MNGRKYPAPGAFFRPVGRMYGYCFEIVEVIEQEGRSHWTMCRWGMTKDRQPVDDGHKSLFYLTNLAPLKAGVLKTASELAQRYICEPRYYREIKVKGQQQELFA